MASMNIHISKTLSWLLRHGAAKEGVHMDDGGYVEVAEVLRCLARKKGIGAAAATVDRIQDIVAACPKQRFELMTSEKGKLYIRATQGHSIKDVADDSLLTPLTEADLEKYPVAVHGTTHQAWPLIEASGGLKSGTRNHIHIAIGEPGAGHVVSGARATSDVLIYIDLGGALAAGIKFFVSTNGVILTRGVDDSGFLPAAYFARVVHVRK